MLPIFFPSDANHPMRSLRLTLIVAVLIGSIPAARAELSDEALTAAKRATAFLTEKVSTEGGYLWAYSADLKHREGEGVVKTETVWVQPPGTPTLGTAFVRLYNATAERQFLDAALAAADALRRGQMRSGGWQAMIEFEPDRRRKWAYRLDPPSKRGKDQSSLDDDKTQSALRFVMRLDHATDMQIDWVHSMAQYALDGLLTKGQFSGGGFPQVWTDQRDPDRDTPLVKANFPDQWPRGYPGHNEYWERYTLNDNLARDVMKTLFLADEIYQDKRYREAAIRLADSLIAAQLPEPQPGWAQQYNEAMQPIWARKFEPPAITSSESFSTLEALMMIYRKTGDEKYLKPIPAALDYFRRCELEDGRVARFYEWKTNRPLYFDREYRLTYDDSDMPTHYGFQLQSAVETLRRKFERLQSGPPKPPVLLDDGAKRPSERSVREIVDALDDSGIWVRKGSLKYANYSGRVIRMRQVAEHLESLAAFLDRG